MAEDKWFAVQTVFLIEAGAVLEDAGQSYEERITVWRAGSAQAAFEKGQIEAERYGEETGFEQLDYVYTYEMFDSLAEGAEVWSVTRRSWLTPAEYIERFLEDGIPRNE